MERRFDIPQADIDRVMSYTETILGMEVHYFDSFFGSQDAVDYDEFDIRDLYIYLNHTLFSQNLKTLRPDLRLELTNSMKNTYGWAGYRRKGQEYTPTHIKLNTQLLVSKRALMETFIHEMVHIYNYEYDNYAGHGRPFYDAYYQVGFKDRNFGIPRARSREHIYSNMSFGEVSGLEHVAKALFRVGQEVLNPYTDVVEPIIKVLKNEVVLASGQRLWWTHLVDKDNFLQVPEGVEIPTVDPLLLEQQLGLDDLVVPEEPKPVVLTPQSEATQRILQRTRDRKLSERRKPPPPLKIEPSRVYELKKENKSYIARLRDAIALARVRGELKITVPIREEFTVGNFQIFFLDSQLATISQVTTSSTQLKDWLEEIQSDIPENAQYLFLKEIDGYSTASGRSDRQIDAVLTPKEFPAQIELVDPNAGKRRAMYYAEFEMELVNRAFTRGKKIVQLGTVQSDENQNEPKKVTLDSFLKELKIPVGSTSVEIGRFRWEKIDSDDPLKGSRFIDQGKIDAYIVSPPSHR